MDVIAKWIGERATMHFQWHEKVSSTREIMLYMCWKGQSQAKVESEKILDANRPVQSEVLNHNCEACDQWESTISSITSFKLSHDSAQ